MSKKLAKHTSKIMRCTYSTIFNVFLLIFQHYSSLLDCSGNKGGGIIWAVKLFPKIFKMRKWNQNEMIFWELPIKWEGRRTN